MPSVLSSPGVRVNLGRPRACLDSEPGWPGSGEAWTTAARHHDAEHAASDTGVDGGQQQPIIAERGWSTRARVRITTTTTVSAVSAVDPMVDRTFQAGEELTMVQWGGVERRPVERDCRWTSTDIDGAHIIAADRGSRSWRSWRRSRPPSPAPHYRPIGSSSCSAPRRRHGPSRASSSLPAGGTWRCGPAHPGTGPSSCRPTTGCRPACPHAPRVRARPADGERIRCKNVPGVKAPTKVRP